jgi:DNA-3-methyladenine glycosylase I
MSDVPPDGSCPWPGSDLGYRAYHDQEWGRPVHDDHRLFEKLALEGFQSGLSWLTILRKRVAFQEVFAGFDPAVVAGYGTSEVERLLRDARIIRHRGKIEATITNATVVLDIASEFGSFDTFVWGFAPAYHRRPSSLSDIPATTPAAAALAKALKAHGARFVGPTTAYAFMQAMGLVNDHLVGCPAGAALDSPGQS